MYGTLYIRALYIYRGGALYSSHIYIEPLLREVGENEAGEGGLRSWRRGELGERRELSNTTHRTCIARRNTNTTPTCVVIQACISRQT